MTPQTEIPKKSGWATGAYYEGVVAVAMGGPERQMFWIFAADIETLRDVWNGVVDGPLNEDRIQRVAIFSKSAVSEVVPSC